MVEVAWVFRCPPAMGTALCPSHPDGHRGDLPAFNIGAALSPLKRTAGLEGWHCPGL